MSLLTCRSKCAQLPASGLIDASTLLQKHQHASHVTILGRGDECGGSTPREVADACTSFEQLLDEFLVAVAASLWTIAMRCYYILRVCCDAAPPSSYNVELLPLPLLLSAPTVSYPFPLPACQYLAQKLTVEGRRSGACTCGSESCGRSHHHG